MYFNNIIQKIKLPFRKDKELYLCLYQILGFYPKNIAYYKQALMHKSASVKGKNGHWQNNERLEFLGDAILDAVVGDVVYRHFENKREGFLTNARSKIVQRETLGKLAIEVGLDRLIQFNQHRNNAHNSYMAGNAFEALVGAIYLDYGYDRCMKFMEKRILNHIIDVDKVAYKEVNFKSKLLEWSQKNRIRLEFRDLPQSTDKGGVSMFNTIVVIEDLDCGRGKGYSKKESQQNAAQDTLIMLKKQKGFEESVFEAKSRRTAMEEQPEALLPEIPDELLIKQPQHKESPSKSQSESNNTDRKPKDKPKAKSEDVLPREEEEVAPKEEKSQKNNKPKPKASDTHAQAEEGVSKDKKKESRKPKTKASPNPEKVQSQDEDGDSQKQNKEEQNSKDKPKDDSVKKQLQDNGGDKPKEKKKREKKQPPKEENAETVQERGDADNEPVSQPKEPKPRRARKPKATAVKNEVAESGEQLQAPAQESVVLPQQTAVEDSSELAETQNVLAQPDAEIEAAPVEAKPKRRRGSRRKSTSLGAANPSPSSSPMPN